MAVITVVQTGSTLVSPAVVNRNTKKSAIAYTGLFQRRRNRIEVPVKAFIVEINGRKILIDTGWSKECCDHPIKHMGFALWFASEPLVTKEETVYSYLKNKTIAPCDLDAIILTHLDCDHASGLVDLKTAKHIYTTEEELKRAQSFDVRYKKSFWRGIDFEILNMSDDVTAPFGKSCDLFGDGSVKAIFTPGHSAGSVAVVISDNGKFAVIAGDDGYNSESWEDTLLPGPVYDKESMRKTLKWINEMNRKDECAGIFVAHDPEISKGEYLL